MPARRGRPPLREAALASELRIRASDAALIAVVREGYGKAITQVEAIILSCDDGDLIRELHDWIQNGYKSLEQR